MGKGMVSIFLIAMLVVGTPSHALAATSDSLILTEQETEYFSGLKSLRVLTTPNMQPYAYKNMGVSIDILEHLCESADIELEVIEAESYEDALLRLENGEAELAAVKFSPHEDTENILPYLDVPLQMVHHNQVRPLEQLSLYLARLQGLDLFDDKHTIVDAITFASVRECLDAVRSQQSDVFLCDSYQLSIFSESFTAWNLAVTTIPNREVTVGFGLNADTDVRLISALQSTVDTFEPRELIDSLTNHMQIHEKGFRLTRFVYQNPFELLCVVSSLFFVILFCVYVFFRIRSSQHQELRGYEESYRMLAETFGEAGLEYDYLNDRFTFFGGRRDRIDMPEIVEQVHTALEQGTVRISVMPEELDKLLQNNVQDQSYQVELQCGMKEGNWNWFRMIYIVVCTSESHRRPIRLIGCLVNIEEEYREKERLLKIGYQDPLTGLLNRASGECEIIHALDYNTMPKVLLFLDIDYFKKFNDLHGHSGGDAVLIALGTALREIFSPDDILCRWGGDEFILMIKGEGARENRLYDSLQKLQERMKSISYLGKNLSATLSIGGVFASPGLSFQYLFEVADATLYEVKDEGRNHFRVVYRMSELDVLSREVIE